jgi:hypothetical protein
MDRRDSFLLAMYAQMWSNINRHILVIWQPVTALFGAFAIFALIKTDAIPFDLGCAFLVLICAWLSAHVIDANYWFARNLLIVANIERQFLQPDDTRLILYYFAKEHKPTELDHLTIQAWLARGVFALVIGWHFFTRVVPGFGSPWNTFELAPTLPYAVSLIATGSLVLFWQKRKKAYAVLLEKSPGLPVNDCAVPVSALGPETSTQT